MAETERSGRRIFRGIMQQGFSLATLYCSIGLLLELLHHTLPDAVYERAAVAVYGLPVHLLGRLGIQQELIALVAHGELPVWLASAVVPAMGVAVILLTALVVGSTLRFAWMVAGFRQRSPGR